MKKFFYILSLLFAFTTLTACAISAGTEVGNPAKRILSGNLAGVSASVNFSALSSTQLTTASCTDAGSPIDVVLVDYINVTEDSVASDDAGSFSGEINQDSRYEVHFSQNGTECGILYYTDEDRWAGLYVLIGKGTQDIDLGSVTDLGGGIFVSENNPSSYCDDDSDGETDDVDDDVDNDGLDDDDANSSGYPIWYDEDDDGDEVDD